MSHFLRRSLLVAIGAMVSVASGRAVGRAVLFPASEVVTAEIPNDFERDDWMASDGVAVHAIGLAAPAGGHTIVYFHNNRETMASRVAIARALHERGFGILLVEYRGYGLSRGSSPSEDGLYLDAECALDMLAHRGILADRIVLWGTSLGTGVAAEMARRGRGSKLVLEAPYTSIPDIVSNVAPFLPARVFMTDRFDTLSKASEIHVPTLVIHGDADEIVPFWMGEKLAHVILGARLVAVSGGRHGDLFARVGARLLDEITGFGT